MGAVEESIGILRSLLHQLSIIPEDLFALGAKAQVHIRIGEMLQEAGKEEASCDSEFKAAIQIATRGLGRFPDDKFLYDSRGNAFESMWQFEAAIADYDRIVGLSPQDPLGYYLRGRAMRIRATVLTPVVEEDLVNAKANLSRAICLAGDHLLGDVCFGERGAIGFLLFELSGNRQFHVEGRRDIHEAAMRATRRDGKRSETGKQMRHALARQLRQLRAPWGLKGIPRV